LRYEIQRSLQKPLNTSGGTMIPIKIFRTIIIFIVACLCFRVQTQVQARQIINFELQSSPSISQTILCTTNRDHYAANAFSIIGFGIALAVILFLSYRLISQRKRYLKKIQKARRICKRCRLQTNDCKKLLKASIQRSEELANEASSAQKAKSEFLANMSHEIRTPMNAIIGFSEVLTEQKLTDEQSNYVDIIRQSSENLLNLINDILDYVQIEADKFNPDLYDYPVKTLLAEIEATLRPRAIERGLEYSIITKVSLPKYIRTDPKYLRKCIDNLINNATKFTHSGSITVTVSQIKSNSKSFIKFAVSDTGIGVEKDKQNSIFDVFIQADGGATRRYSGTGLGLPISKKLAALLGGELTMKSDFGSGSVFTLTVPVGIEHVETFRPEENIPTEQLEQDLDSVKFEANALVAEDCLTNQELIKLLLKKIGITVTIAQNGIEAVEIAKRTHFDLILMDIQMPNMDGYDATAEMRKLGIDAPIIALTAYALEGDEQKCLDAGCVDYLKKPIDRKSFISTLLKHIPASLAQPELEIAANATN